MRDSVQIYVKLYTTVIVYTYSDTGVYDCMHLITATESQPVNGHVYLYPNHLSYLFSF